MNTVMVTIIVQAPASAFHDAVDLSKNLLSFEVAGDVVALTVLRRSLSGNPDYHSARRDHSRRKRARQLERRLRHVLGRLRGTREQYGEQHCRDTAHAWAPDDKQSESEREKEGS